MFISNIPSRRRDSTIGVQSYVVSGLLSSKPASGLAMALPGGTACLGGYLVDVPASSYTYPTHKFTVDELKPDGTVQHTSFDSYADIPALPVAPAVLRLQMVSTDAANITGVFDRRAVEPLLGQKAEAGFDWRKIFAEMRFGSGYYQDAYRYAANGGIRWYFSNIAMYFLVERDPAAVKAYLDRYTERLDVLTNSGYSYVAIDVRTKDDARKTNPNVGDESWIGDYSLAVDNSGVPVEPWPEDSHDSYAATFLSLAVKYVRSTGDWAWLAATNKFNETNWDTLLNIGLDNILNQIKTTAWATAHGYPVGPNSGGADTLLLSPFQRGQRPARGITPLLTYYTGLLEDGCEVYRAIKEMADLMADIGDSNAATWAAHAANIGIALHGLYDVSRNIWCWNDTQIDWASGSPPTWSADASGVGTAWYADLVSAVFPEAFGVPSAGGHVYDGTKFNFGWERLNQYAPSWSQKRVYDDFPWLIIAWMAAAKRKDAAKAMQALDTFKRYFLVPGQPTTGFALLSEVGYAMAIQDLLIDQLRTEQSGCYGNSELLLKKLTAMQRVSMPAREQSVTAATAIQPQGSVAPISATANVTMTATPAITAGTDGQEIELVNIGATYWIELQDKGTLPDSGLVLAAPVIRLEAGQSLRLIYVAALSAWVQTGSAMRSQHEVDHDVTFSAQVILSALLAGGFLTLDAANQILALSAADARTNLDVYDKSDVYSKAEITTLLGNYVPANTYANHHHVVSAYDGAAGGHLHTDPQGGVTSTAPDHQHFINTNTGLPS